ncbi:MAG: hypothetical protein ABFQ62_01900 [Patescibacteria group bacterium]
MTNLHTSIILQIPKSENHRSSVIKSLVDFEHAENLKANNPNLNIFEPEENKKISIELVRNMISEASMGIYSGDIRVMILTHSDTASIPAQNSLLKLVEEPPTNTQIILTVSNPNQLLPTIRSRCILVKNSAKPSPFSGEGTLPTSYSAAITLAEKYKDRKAAIELVENLIQNLHEQNSDSPNFKTTKNLKILSATLQHLHANVNVRLALEHGLFEMV